MTVQNTSIRKAGPSACNGITTAFPFTFKVFLTSDVVVTYTNLSAVEVTLTLGTDYTVTLNSDQNTTPGGTVTLLTAPASGTYITLTSQVTNTQNLALTNAGGFYPTSINDALDRVVILIQQLAEQVSRSVKVSVSSTTNPDQLVSSVATSAASSAASAASSLASLNEFKGVYYGSYASAPATDPLGNAIAAGDMYYNTTSQSLQIYTSTGWQATAQATPVSYSSQTFNGTGAQTAFTLSSAPATLVATEVFISGVRQRPTTDYTISGTTLTFVSAPATGTNNIFVRWTYAIAVGVPNDASVTPAKLSTPNAVYWDGVGNVGVNTSSPSSYGKFAVSTTTANDGVNIVFPGSPGTAAVGTNFWLTNNSAVVKQAYINAQTDGGSVGAENAHISFGTIGSGTLSERMRIDSAGNTLINQTTSDTGAKLSVTGGIKGTITSGTAVATTSGTAIDFTGIPSWAKRVTVIFNGVSTAGVSSTVQIQVGSGSIQTTGYVTSASYISGTNTCAIGANISSGFCTGSGNIANAMTGHYVITAFGSNQYIMSGNTITGSAGQGVFCAGAVALSGVLDRLRITTVNGTDTFDAGAVNILYEG